MIVRVIVVEGDGVVDLLEGKGGLVKVVVVILDLGCSGWMGIWVGFWWYLEWGIFYSGVLRGSYGWWSRVCWLGWIGSMLG